MKILALLVGALLAINTSVRANCVAGDCINGEGKAQFKNGDVYAGQWANGLMHGRGIYIFRTRARYEGQFVKGAMQGQGIMRYPDGAMYVGEWVANEKSGRGKLTTPSGKTQDGLWRSGQFAGAAPPPVSSRPSKPSSKPNNAATVSSIHAKPNPSTSTPAASNSGLRNCNSVFCEDGAGRYEYRDGAVYEGEFEDGQPSGTGIVRYVNGDSYRGEWFGNAPDGEGTYTFASGKSVFGRWDEGKLVQRLYRNETGTVASQPATKPAASKPATTAPTRINKPADGRQDMYAVVVGIGAYAAMKTLNYTDDDAYQMYAFLKSPEGGALADEQVEVLVDERATSANIERALREKLGKADADDIVVFYYSGHGVDGYFIPVDFDGVHNLLSHKRIEELFDASAARHKLVVADACHSGSLLAAKSSSSRSTERLYEAFAKSSGGTALLLSSRTEEVSLEASGLRSGVFSHYLMRGMKGEADIDHDRIVTVSELFNYTYSRVRDYTGKRQTPVLSGNFDRMMPVASLRD